MWNWSKVLLTCGHLDTGITIFKVLLSVNIENALKFDFCEDPCVPKIIPGRNCIYLFYEYTKHTCWD